MIHIAMPAMGEENLCSNILNLCNQSLLPSSVCVCINNPASYEDSQDYEHRQIVKLNSISLSQLKALKLSNNLPFKLHIIDKSSKGLAFEDKYCGVGFARRFAMDMACENADNSDLIVCMDADTIYPSSYLESMQKPFLTRPDIVGIAGAYYHNTKSLVKNGAISEKQAISALRYEVYMRCFSLCMLHTSHPYRFTAIGSSMACTAKAYRKVNGISPKKSGEDFYFLQNLSKNGSIAIQYKIAALPSARVSSRVIFGTGPAIAMGMENKWDSCPIYPVALFKDLNFFYSSLGFLYTDPTFNLGKVGAFAEEKWGRDWALPLRKNSKTKEAFVSACIRKFDALRSLQFLKSNYKYDTFRDALNLKEIAELYNINFPISFPARSLCLDSFSLNEWEEIRNALFRCERLVQNKNPYV